MQAFGGGGHGIGAAAWVPAEHGAGLVVADVADLAEVGQHTLQGGVGPDRLVHGLVEEFLSGNGFGGGAEAFANGERHLVQGDGVARSGEEAPSGGLGVAHGAQVKLGGVADADDGEVQPWGAGQGSAETGW